ncbi:MAG: high-affinity zinc transporter periplasmic component [Methanosaeta sp. PtaU1.Bin060]|jgi:zinc transport system substrate-binding protein|nr:MAG: high-affinity zinc transporter periplasmic component [Methanosaeta sp. PtaU1.Bin060]
MNKTSLLVLLLLIVPLLSGCVSEKESAGQVKVATTIIPLGEFVQAVGKDRVNVTVLVPPGAEPHTFEPSPSQIRDVANADVYVENGAGLERWMSSILNVNSHMLVVDSSKGVDLLAGEAEGADEAITSDPHIWLSPHDAAIQVQNIRDGLVSVDPAGKDDYINNTNSYLAELKALDAYLNSTFAETKRKKFVVLHPAWTYFARDYGLEQIAIEAEEKDPGPRLLAEIVEACRKENITTVFVEPQFNPKMAEVIAQEIQGKVVSIDGLAPTPSYIENMKSVGEKIAESLR